MWRATALAGPYNFLVDVVPAVNRITDGGLLANSSYFYQVAGFNSASSVPSQPAGRMTRHQAPINPLFKSVYSSSITVQWFSNNGAGADITRCGGRLQGIGSAIGGLRIGKELLYSNGKRKTRVLDFFTSGKQSLRDRRNDIRVRLGGIDDS